MERKDFLKGGIAALGVAFIVQKGDNNSINK